MKLSTAKLLKRISFILFILSVYMAFQLSMQLKESEYFVFEFFYLYIAFIILFALTSISLFMISIKRYRSDTLVHISVSLSSIVFIIILVESLSFISLFFLGDVSAGVLADSETSEIMNVEDRNAIEYIFDEFGRRDVGTNYNTNYSNIILFGDSFTFGYKLYDNETLQHHLDSLVDHNIYNYAQVGDGPHNTLHLFNKDKEEAFADIDMNDESNIAIFQFLPEEHTRRASARPPNSIKRIFTDPSYIYDEEEKLVEGKSFYKDRYLRSLTHANYWFLRKNSYFLTQFAPSNIFLSATDEDIELTSDIILNMSEIYEKRFEGQLFILFAPFPMYENEDLRNQYIELFEKNEIDYLSYNIDGEREDYIISEFKHPNSRLNKELAKFLKQNVLS